MYLYWGMQDTVGVSMIKCLSVMCRTEPIYKAWVGSTTYCSIGGKRRGRGIVPGGTSTEAAKPLIILSVRSAENFYACF